MPPRMTLTQLRATPVGRTNAALLDTPRARVPRCTRPVDGADTLLALVQTLTTCDDPVVAQAAQVVARMTRDQPFQRFRIDLADTASLTAVEINGGRWQPGGGKHATARDRQKIRQLQQAGWIVLEFVTSELHADTISVIHEIAQTVTARQGEQP